jgi:hypothetical protein
MGTAPMISSVQNKTQTIQSNLQISDTPKNKIIKWIEFSLVTLVITIVLIGSFFVYKTFFIKPMIKTYEECVKAKGSIIQESSSQVCVTKNGFKFTGRIIPSSFPLTKAGKCYEQIINSKCPEGVECVQVVPEDAFCQCMGGLAEIRGKKTEEQQYEACVINGKDYDGITFQDFEQGWYWGDINQKKLGTPNDWTLSDSGTRNAKWYKSGESSFLSPSEQPTMDESFCAKAGERSVNNLDMTTGKINPKIQAKNCCLGLKNIAEKQPTINNNPDLCSQNFGVSYNLCSPCGNGVCDSQYEDHCNCPEDCR